MALLVDWQILQRMAEGESVIAPFNREHLHTVSYDVTLGEYFVRARFDFPDGMFDREYTMFNPKSEESIGNRWSEPEKAESARYLLTKEEMKRHSIPPDDRVIALKPSELILAHTNEFVGGVRRVTTSMHARSTAGRSGISVCMCAGFGDVGYFNRWTMEIRNNGPYIIILTVGVRIAQIHFESVEVPEQLYSSTGHYQSTTNLEQLIGSWDPKSMLPKPM